MAKEDDRADDYKPCANDSARVRRKRYKPPQLITYGSIARLTAGVNGSTHDPGHNTGTKQGHG